MFDWPVPVAMRSEAYVCGRTIAGVTISDEAEGMNICVCGSCVLCR